MLRIGGFTPLALSDWPGQLAAVVFCQGCPWRCRYCHNPHLLPRRAVTSLKWQDVLAFLGRRRGLLDAVVFSGGEPTLQSELPRAITAVKALGFKAGLHTAGIYPQRLARVLPLIDWVGMDIKAPFAAYAATTGRRDSDKAALESVRLILASGVHHEFRTTVHSALLSPSALLETARTLATLGARRYALQEFRPTGCADAALTAAPAPWHPDGEFAAAIAHCFPEFSVRRA